MAVAERNGVVQMGYERRHAINGFPLRTGAACGEKARETALALLGREGRDGRADAGRARPRARGRLRPRGGRPRLRGGPGPRGQLGPRRPDRRTDRRAGTDDRRRPVARRVRVRPGRRRGRGDGPDRARQGRRDQRVPAYPRDPRGGRERPRRPRAGHARRGAARPDVEHVHRERGRDVRRVPGRVRHGHPPDWLARRPGRPGPRDVPVQRRVPATWSRTASPAPWSGTSRSRARSWGRSTRSR